MEEKNYQGPLHLKTKCLAQKITETQIIACWESFLRNITIFLLFTYTLLDTYY